MNQLLTTAIVLRRTDYGEADRILTVLTPEEGKLTLLAKGVRRVKSKLAGGIELFSISQLTFMRGRGDMGRLVSSRLDKHFGQIVTDINRTMLGYELIQKLDKATEDNPEAEYFQLLQQAFEALDDLTINTALIQVWFLAQLVRLAGHTPNLETDIQGQRLQLATNYEFQIDDMTFLARPDGTFTANHIKFLRLLFSTAEPSLLQRVDGCVELTLSIQPLVNLMARTFVRV